MTDYNALAQRIVARGVGKDYGGKVWRYRIIGTSGLLEAEEFCNDGRVVLALMEKMGEFKALLSGPDDDETWQVKAWCGKEGVGMDDSLAIAICEACCEALEHD